MWPLTRMSQGGLLPRPSAVECMQQTAIVITPRALGSFSEPWKSASQWTLSFICPLLTLCNKPASCNLLNETCFSNQGQALEYCSPGCSRQKWLNFYVQWLHNKSLLSSTPGCFGTGELINILYTDFSVSWLLLPYQIYDFKIFSPILWALFLLQVPLAATHFWDFQEYHPFSSFLTVTVLYFDIL